LFKVAAYGPGASRVLGTGDWVRGGCGAAGLMDGVLGLAPLSAAALIRLRVVRAASPRCRARSSTITFFVMPDGQPGLVGTGFLRAFGESPSA